MNARRRSHCFPIEPLEQRRLLSANSLDTSFNNGGFVTHSFDGGFNNARAVAVQTDGKVVVVGQSGNGFAAVRYNADGTLDDGGVNDSTPGDHFGVDGEFLYTTGSSADATCVAIQKDGKIVIAGTTNTTGQIVQQAWLIVRLKTDGTFDTTFNGGTTGLSSGISNTPLNAIALQSDGKIVVAGSIRDGATGGDFYVGRFTADGQLDDDFDGGTVTTDFGGTDIATGVAIDNLGRIVAVGGVRGNGFKQDIGAVRYLSDGSLDSSFYAAGKAVNKEQSDASSVAVHNAVITADGKIEIAASLLFSNSGKWQGGNAEFSTDSSGGGIVFSEQRHKYSALTLMPDGEIAYAGVNLGLNQDENRLEVSLPASETKEPTLGVANATATAIAAGPDGSFYVAGFTDPNVSNRDFLLVKFVGVDPNSWGTVSGNIYRDSDGDGVKDPNEKGIANVKVFTDYDNDGIKNGHQFQINEHFVLTDSNGNYTFAGLMPGLTPIRQVLPSKTTVELPSAGKYDVTVVGGTTVFKRNFVDKPFVFPSTATAFSGSVFNDWNSNTTREVKGSPEPDIAGVFVYLDANKNGTLDKGETFTKTDVSGNYTITLPKAGTYRVAVSLPKGFVSTTTSFFDVKVANGVQVVRRFALTPSDKTDTITEANAQPAISTSKSLFDSINSATNVNIYRFTVSAGQTILFDLDVASGYSLDSYLKLFDASGTQLAKSDNSAAPGEGVSLDPFIKFKFTTAGTYYIAVSDHLNASYSPTTGKGDIGSGTRGKYSLSVSGG